LPGEQQFYPVAYISANGANDGEKYALLSRFPGPQCGRYVMLLGSAHSELPWALAEYVTNPISMRELVQHLKLPSGDLPDAFQVLLRVTLQAQVPVRIRYVTHQVLTDRNSRRGAVPNQIAATILPHPKSLRAR
jgi:hypothetical protein